MTTHSRVSYPQKVRDNAKAAGKNMFTYDHSSPVSNGARTTIQRLIDKQAGDCLSAFLINVLCMNITPKDAFDKIYGSPNCPKEISGLP